MMHLKNTLIAITVLLVIGLSHNTSAQHDPQLSLYMFNKHVYNPGFTGMEGVLSIVGAFRSQWTGFDGRPVTQTISVHAPTGNTLGFGGYIINDMAGVDRSTSFNGSMSFRKQFSFGTISIGVGGGLLQQALDGTLYEPAEGKGTDPFIPTELVTAQTPDFSIGVYLNDEVNQRYYAGLSMTHLTAPTLVFDIPSFSTLNLTFNRTMYAVGGYRFTLGNSYFDLEPSVLIKSDLVKTQFDLNANLVYKSSLYGGLSLRGVSKDSRDAVVVIVGMNLSNAAFIAYSYDMTLYKGT